MRRNKMKSSFGFEDLGFAKVDHHRVIRKGFPEVIYCQGKTDRQIVKIFEKLAKKGNTVIATRATPEHFKAVAKAFRKAVYHKEARMISLINPKSQTLNSKQYQNSKFKKTKRMICVITAGTADIPVAEEAAVTAELLGNTPDRIYDVGVAGIHRLFNKLDRISQASVIIVVAGMEGALASVVAGLVQAPVIAVPTSIGYGASFKGLAALLTMMNSCAPGVAVVNIDNGFGAGVMAHTILHSPCQGGAGGGS
jgi:pyridinium-3,5-biscarboxylic acid mononucleotide synthase